MMVNCKNKANKHLQIVKGAFRDKAFQCNKIRVVLFLAFVCLFMQQTAGGPAWKFSENFSLSKTAYLKETTVENKPNVFFYKIT